MGTLPNLDAHHAGRRAHAGGIALRADRVRHWAVGPHPVGRRRARAGHLHCVAALLWVCRVAALENAEPLRADEAGGAGVHVPVADRILGAGDDVDSVRRHRLDLGDPGSRGAAGVSQRTMGRGCRADSPRDLREDRPPVRDSGHLWTRPLPISVHRGPPDPGRSERREAPSDAPDPGHVRRR